MGNTVEANPKVADGKEYAKRGKYSLKKKSKARSHNEARKSYFVMIRKDFL
jgi:hypothetical protein